MKKNFMPPLIQTCPICKKQVDNNELHPNYICFSCSRLATDVKGDKVIFFHSLFIGDGLIGYNRRNDELIPFNGSSCFINGKRCMARYDHSDGIVLEPV